MAKDWEEGGVKLPDSVKQMRGMVLHMSIVVHMGYVSFVTIDSQS
jgi:hypothetical protein